MRRFFLLLLWKQDKECLFGLEKHIPVCTNVGHHTSGRVSFWISGASALQMMEAKRRVLKNLYAFCGEWSGNKEKATPIFAHILAIPIADYNLSAVTLAST